MPRFAANLSMMFTEVPFMERFGRAAAAGFKAVEYLFPYDFPAEDIARELKRHKLKQALFNLPPGDWGAGERGLTALPGREEEFRQALETALDYAKVLGNTRVHAMAGILPSNLDRDTARRTYLGNLTRAAARAAEDGVTIVLEPINQRDMPGYFLSYTGEAKAVIEEVGAPNLKLQFDLYHCQIMEGDLTKRVEALFPLIDHMQIAGVPDRHEPDQGEVNYPYLFDQMDGLGFKGWVGCEYRPKGATEEGLDWFRAATGS